MRVVYTNEWKSNESDWRKYTQQVNNRKRKKNEKHPLTPKRDLIFRMAPIDLSDEPKKSTKQLQHCTKAHRFEIELLITCLWTFYNNKVYVHLLTSASTAVCALSEDQCMIYSCFTNRSDLCVQTLQLALNLLD